MIVLIVMFVITSMSMQGCSAPKTKAHRLIMEHQTEGRLVYREDDGVQYYVECEYGFKYLSSSVAEERIGPIDQCVEEE